MQKILSLNIIDNKCEILLQNDNILIDKIFIEENNRQSDLLVLKIQQLLEKNNISYKDIDVMSVNNGPASFTTLKVVMTFVKAFHVIFPEKNIIVNNTFELVAYNKNFDIIILPSGLNTYFVYDKNHYFFVKQCDLNQILQANYTILTNSQNIVDFLKNDFKITLNSISDDNLVNLNFDKLNKKIFSQDLEPLYIREPDINRSKK